MSALKSLSGFCNHSPLFFLIMKRVKDLFRHICLIFVGILLSNFIQSSDDLSVPVVKNTTKTEAQTPRLVLASITPVVTKQEIEQLKTIEKVIPHIARIVEKQRLANKTSKEDESGPSRWFAALIKSTASSLARKYNASPPVIEIFLREACKQQYEVGIPAPVIIAIALKESSFKSSLFRQTGNPFGIKAGKSWNGPTISIRRHGHTIRFPKYDSAEEAVVDFGRQIRSKWWYADALNCSFEDFNAVVRGLEKTTEEPGYALNDDWGENILQIIEENDLGQLCRR